MSSTTGDSATAFWAAEARASLYWLHCDTQQWLTHTDDGWSGWSLPHFESVGLPREAWPQPWTATVDSSCAPLLRWFAGGVTNAAFNELDAHVLMSTGSDPSALHSEQPAGIGLSSASVSLQQLFVESVEAACMLSSELAASDRVALNMINAPAVVCWVEACKRVAMPYLAVAAGTPSASLALRMHDVGAAALVASPSLTAVGRTAVDQLAVAQPLSRRPLLLVPSGSSGACGCGTLTRVAISSAATGADSAAAVGAHDAPVPDVAVCLERAELRAGAAADEADRSASLVHASDRSTSLVRRCSGACGARPVEASFPLFVLYTSGSTGRPKGIVHTHGGYEVGLAATARLVLAATPTDVLFVVATPGWITGQSYMLATALLLRMPSVLLEGSPVSPVADRFAAIIARRRVTVLKTGSTMVRMLMTSSTASALLTQHDLSSLRLGLLCAEPVHAATHAYAAAHLVRDFANCYWATEHGGILFGAVHSHALPATLRRLKASGLQAASPPLVPDGRTWPLPWIGADTLVESGGAEGAADSDGKGEAAAADGADATGGEGSSLASSPAAARRARAADGERGELIVRGRWPYMALTVWASEGFEEWCGVARGGDPRAWTGHLARWAAYFAPGSAEGELVYVQGDTAVRHASRDEPDAPDTACVHFTLHGRSDEVLNVGGNRVGTEEIEHALLGAAVGAAAAADCLGAAPGEAQERLVRTCAVVGRPHHTLGHAPCAFLVLAEGARWTRDAEAALLAAVRAHVGGFACPDKWVVVPTLPETWTGKYVRRVLRALLSGEPLGDLAGLKNPECLPPLRAALATQKLLLEPASTAPGAAAAAAGAVAVTTGSAAGVSAAGALADGPPTLLELLERLGLQGHLSAMDDEGYEELDTWLLLSEEEAKDVMADDVGMSEKEMDAFAAALKEVREKHAQSSRTSSSAVALT